MKCPKCHSTQIYIDKRGFKTGRAIAGGLITGNIFAAAASGGIGMNKIQCTCLKCGYKFKPNEAGGEYSQREINEFESHVIKREEAEKTHMYRCDCGKESSLPIGSPVCPRCGRKMNDSHKFTPNNRTGCLPIAFLSILVLVSAIFSILL